MQKNFKEIVQFLWEQTRRFEEEKYSRKCSKVVAEASGGETRVNRCLKRVDLTLHGENEPPQLNFPDSMQIISQNSHDAAKNFRPSTPTSPSSIRIETQVEETSPIDFPSMKVVVEDPWMDLVMGFVDEEEMFNMPVLVNSMAEGMLLTPPAMKRGFKWSHDIEDDVNCISLWVE